MNMKQRYHPSQILLHAVIGLLIVLTFAFGKYVAGLPLSPAKFQLISYHKWGGMLVLLLVVLRIVLRLLKGAPPLPATMSPLARLAAHAAHLALYVLMLAVPLSGWLMSSAYGFPVVLFGVLPLPDLIAANPALAEQLGEVHELLNRLLLITVILHVLAALKHHFIDRDGLLQRMSLRR
ncbi:cytochrome b [Vogesella fluminis]|uniref:Cytochrome b n=1 Tax=Vogesella fluminis TaxID=1069161 RepID=A0ABQ3H7B7_9NEIS|nr:cytochrome b [Vogesella fluminis]GHD71998.1 cytochrome b [Vogesella fluminis]